MLIESPTPDWNDYELIDCGDFEKLERFGRYCLRRPEPKALWAKSMTESQWNRMCHTHFKPGAGFGKAGKEDSGSWEMFRKMDEQWPIAYPLSNGKSLKLRLGLTSFKHVGVFPEQAGNWNWIFDKVSSMRAEASPGSQATEPRVLNLFAYTGAASLSARAAGAQVTHLDSVRQVVSWARQNMEMSGLDGIHWVVEDAMKFVEREGRRGHLYDGILLDPPAYGHGTDGERWKLDECLFKMLKGTDAILSPKNSFVILNLYSNGFSSVLAETIARESFRDIKSLEYGELVLCDRFGKRLPLSVFVRLTR